MNPAELLYLIVVVLFLSMAMIVTLLVERRKASIAKKKFAALFERLADYAVGSGELSAAKGSHDMLFALKELKERVQIDPKKAESIVAMIDDAGITAHYVRRLRSCRSDRRIEAVSYLSVIGSETALSALRTKLSSERSYQVKLFIISGLAELGDKASIPVMAESLRKAPSWYRERAHGALMSFGIDILPYVLENVATEDREIRGFALHCAGKIPHPKLREFLLQSSRSEDEPLARAAVEVMGSLYADELRAVFYLKHSDSNIRRASVHSLASSPDRETLELLFSLSDDGEIGRELSFSISSILRKNPSLLPNAVRRFSETENTRCGLLLAEALSERIDYLLYSFSSDTSGLMRETVKKIVSCGQSAGLIGFINRMRNPEIESEILPFLIELSNENEDFREELSHYLSEEHLPKFGLERKVRKNRHKSITITPKDRAILILILSGIILVPPLIYALTFQLYKNPLPFSGLFTDYIARFNWIFAYYSITINSIYLVLLLLSFINFTRQTRQWRMRDLGMIFTRNLFPSVSVLVPAYNEEKTIVDSVNALLNLEYPDYDIIVINDGSGDDTVGALVKYFKMEKTDEISRGEIETEQILGIYKSREVPRLTLIDKLNGGKADSLNAGLNYSKKEFFCCIDADSILQPDALLKIMNRIAVTDKEIIAIGGNIIPVNGFTVQKGQITEVNLSQKPLVIFQTMEYLRSFLAGRLGWASINSLLIISGAFGVFRKKRVVEIGGYMTSRGILKKDTVGEDMELVVRLVRHMREKRLPYRVDYAYNANCYTEVPEEWRIFSKQRARWHRGLLEILLFHKAMLFHPRYGRIGLLSFPYFAIFEVIGPFFELGGYAGIIISALLGVLSLKLGLLLFIACVLYGIFISVSSLIISQNETLSFSMKDTWGLIGASFMENLGYRQIVSIQRVTSYVAYIFRNAGWGKAPRKGFKTASPNPTSHRGG